jgi:hypothetical protein
LDGLAVNYRKGDRVLILEGRDDGVPLEHYLARPQVGIVTRTGLTECVWVRGEGWGMFKGQEIEQLLEPEELRRLD